MTSHAAVEGLSPQVRRLKQIAENSQRSSLAAQRAEAYTRVLSETQGQPQAFRAARCLAAFLEEKDLVLNPDDLLAGHTQFFDYAYPAALGGWTAFLREKDGPTALESGISRTPDYPQVTRADTPFVYANGDGAPRSSEEAWTLEQFCKGVRMGLYGSWPGGHAIAGYDRLLAQGLGGLQDGAAKRLAVGGPGTAAAQAALITCRAATDYILRYAVRAWNLAESSRSREARQCLERIAATCAWVATRPPRTFFEAVQLLWLGHEIITCEQESGSMSLGRLDQYLYPYYLADLNAGRTTRGEAEQIIQALWCKFAHLRRGFQNVTLGGPGPDGRYAANDLSYLCLAATGKLQMDQPALSVRWRADMPQPFWDEMQSLIRTGLGFPALFNDSVAESALERVGIAEADAANYAIVGCVELSIPGREFAHTEGLRINWAKVLELMLHGGTCPVTGETLTLAQPHRLWDLPSFDDFYAWYRVELAHFTDLGLAAFNAIDHDWPRQLPYPFLSALMDGCLASGRDVTDGGTLYNLSSVNGMGMADVVDSLVAIKRLVYQDAQVSLADLVTALRSDFAGAAMLRAQLRAAPHYGNDEDEPDALLAELVGDFCRQVDGYRNPRGGRWQSGLYTVENHARKGKLTGALPSGRSARAALANALSPCQGADTAGPTAVIRSATKIDQARLGNGMVLDLKFHPAFFDDGDRRQAFQALVKTYFQLGGLEIQFNVIARETLLAAQRAPMEHRNLLVRVSGFSAYFVDLDRVCQDEIIARTEQAAV
jgi:pyruvate formate-lyase/glycerol dehydratase family glycyl radical enzyme